MTVDQDTGDRKWLLELAWGSIRTPDAIAHVQTMRANPRWRERDPELAAALDGGLADPEWEEATRPGPNGHIPEIDLETQAAWDADHAEEIPPNLPDWFWSARPVLDHVRRAAWSRLLSPDAVLVALLARVAAACRPQYRLPAVVGAPSSLSFYALLSGPPGTGKSSAVACATELLKIADEKVVDGLSLGSGEGLIESYMGMVTETDAAGKDVTVKRQVRSGAFVTLDEGTALAEMGRRRGSTLLPNLRSMWTGGPVGQANASTDTRRQLPGGTYSLGFVLGIQPARAVELLADDAAGTPQRFVWARSVDPSIPAEPVEWPHGIAWEWTIQPRPREGGGHDFDLEVAGEITGELRTAALARNRGETVVSYLDAHADLLRLKTAGLLAVIDGRGTVTPEDWALAGTVVVTSAAVRSDAVATIEADAARQEDRHRKALVGRDDALERAREAREVTRYTATVEGAARSLATRAAKVGDEGLTRKAVHAAIGGRRHKILGGRAGVDDVIAYAIDLQWLEAKGDRWVSGKARPQ